MTREDAIRELKILKEDYWDDDGYGHETKQYDDTMLALDMAIKALEQDSCEDAVSRQSVKEGMIKYGFHASDMTATEFVEDMLPSVTPEVCIAKIIYNKDDLQKLVDEKVKEIVVERKKGHWILLDECSNSGYYCSKCHKKVVKEGWSNTVKKIKYCPNCGSSMME